MIFFLHNCVRKAKTNNSLVFFFTLPDLLFEVWRIMSLVGPCLMVPSQNGEKGQKLTPCLTVPNQNGEKGQFFSASPQLCTPCLNVQSKQNFPCLTVLAWKGEKGRFFSTSPQLWFPCLTVPKLCSSIESMSIGVMTSMSHYGGKVSAIQVKAMRKGDVNNYYFSSIIIEVTRIYYDV